MQIKQVGPRSAAELNKMNKLVADGMTPAEAAKEITKDMQTCPECHGTGKVKSPGGVSIDCPKCKGTGQIEGSIPKSKDSDMSERCANCGHASGAHTSRGTGGRPCSLCDCKNFVAPTKDAKREQLMRTCWHCDGSGYVEIDGKEVECEYCEGTGELTADSAKDAEAFSAKMKLKQQYKKILAETQGKHDPELEEQLEAIENELARMGGVDATVTPGAVREAAIAAVKAGTSKASFVAGYSGGAAEAAGREWESAKKSTSDKPSIKEQVARYIKDDNYDPPDFDTKEFQDEYMRQSSKSDRNAND